MIERTPILNLMTHLILASGLVIILLPVWLAIVASSLTLQEVNSAPVELWPGDQFWPNLKEALAQSDFGPRFVNSFHRRHRRHPGQGDAGLHHRLRAGVLPVPGSHGDLLGDLHHAEAAARGADRPDLRRRRQCAVALPDDHGLDRHLLAAEQAFRHRGQPGMEPPELLHRADPAPGRHRDGHLPLPPVLPDHPRRAGRGRADGCRCATRFAASTTRSRPHRSS